jgi:hypothetical protein
MSLRSHALIARQRSNPRRLQFRHRDLPVLVRVEYSEHGVDDIVRLILVLDVVLRLLLCVDMVHTVHGFDLFAVPEAVPDERVVG